MQTKLNKRLHLLITVFPLCALKLKLPGPTLMWMGVPSQTYSIPVSNGDPTKINLDACGLHTEIAKLLRSSIIIDPIVISDASINVRTYRQTKTLVLGKMIKLDS